MQRLGYQVIVINIDNNNINTSWILLVIIIFNMKIILSRIPFQHANLVLEGAVRQRGQVIGVKPEISRHRHVVLAIGLVAVREVLG